MALNDKVTVRNTPPPALGRCVEIADLEMVEINFVGENTLKIFSHTRHFQMRDQLTRCVDLEKV